jgi:hypothetical protein
MVKDEFGIAVDVERRSFSMAGVKCPDPESP